MKPLRRHREYVDEYDSVKKAWQYGRYKSSDLIYDLFVWMHTPRKGKQASWARVHDWREDKE